MRYAQLCGTVALVLVTATTGLAQESPVTLDVPEARAGLQTPSSGRVGFRALALTGMTSLLASDSVAALALDSPLEFGGGAEVVNLWRGLFVQGTYSRQSTSGTRVFIDGTGSRFPVGLALDVAMNQVDVGAGWRFARRPSPSGTRRRAIPFVGGGLSLLNYAESSPFSRAGDDLKDSFTGYQAFGGLDINISRWIAVGGQVRYRTFPSSLGEGGVSASLGETNLGGGSVSVRLSIGRW